MRSVISVDESQSAIPHLPICKIQMAFLKSKIYRCGPMVHFRVNIWGCRDQCVSKCNPGTTRILEVFVKVQIPGTPKGLWVGISENGIPELALLTSTQVILKRCEDHWYQLPWNNLINNQYFIRNTESSHPIRIGHSPPRLVLASEIGFHGSFNTRHTVYLIGLWLIEVNVCGGGEVTPSLETHLRKVWKQRHTQSPHHSTGQCGLGGQVCWAHAYWGIPI